MKTFVIFVNSVALLMSIYSYFLYPLLLLLLPRRRRIQPLEMPSSTSDTLPAVTVIIACYNEEQQLDDKIRNTLAVDYPSEKLEIIVASDASGDGSHKIAEGFANRGVRVVSNAKRMGKEYAQSKAIIESSGEVLVFTDAGARVEPNCLKQIVARLANQEIAAISSVDKVLTADGSPEGEGLYQRYEMWLRHLESERSTLIGLTGALFAARREVCTNWNPKVDSDFSTALNTIHMNKVAISEPLLACIYRSIDGQGREYRRKVRTVLRGMNCLSSHRELLNPFRYGLISFQLCSHKIARWLVPWSLATLFVTSLLLARDSRYYQLLLAGQIVFYSASIAGMLSSIARRNAFVRISCFFLVVNAAIFEATIAYFRGKRIQTWEPSQR